MNMGWRCWNELAQGNADLTSWRVRLDENNEAQSFVADVFVDGLNVVDHERLRGGQPP